MILILKFKQEVTPERQSEIIEQIRQWTNVKDAFGSAKTRKCWLLVDDSQVDAVWKQCECFLEELEPEIEQHLECSYDL